MYRKKKKGMTRNSKMYNGKYQCHKAASCTAIYQHSHLPTQPSTNTAIYQQLSRSCSTRATSKKASFNLNDEDGRIFRIKVWKIHCRQTYGMGKKPGLNQHYAQDNSARQHASKSITPESESEPDSAEKYWSTRKPLKRQLTRCFYHYTNARDCRHLRKLSHF